jgi:hypothetical protein
LTGSPSANLRGPRKPFTRARSSTLSTAAALPMNSAWSAIGFISAAWTSTAGGGAPGCCATAGAMLQAAQSAAATSIEAVERRSFILESPLKTIGGTVP